MKTKINKYLKQWMSRGYPNGIPDEAPPELEVSGRVPSWRMVCRAIIKNDVQCTTLGFTREPCALYNEIKRLEIANRHEHT